MKFHFANCKTLHRNLQCGHCACIFTDWHTFIMHVNAKGMSLAQPFSDTFCWQNISYWQNPQNNNNSDILNVAMQHANLPTLQAETPAVSTSFAITTSVPIRMDFSSCPSVTPSSITADIPIAACASSCTQTTPMHYLSPTSDLESKFPPALWQLTANNLHSLKEHVNALLQLNLLLAQLLLSRINPDRPLTANEQLMLQASVSQKLWPHTFLYCSTISELCNALLAWLYEQL